MSWGPHGTGDYRLYGMCEAEVWDRTHGLTVPAPPQGILSLTAVGSLSPPGSIPLHFITTLLLKYSHLIHFIHTSWYEVENLWYSRLIPCSMIRLSCFWHWLGKHDDRSWIVYWKKTMQVRPLEVFSNMAQLILLCPNSRETVIATLQNVVLI